MSLTIVVCHFEFVLLCMVTRQCINKMLFQDTDFIMPGPDYGKWTLVQLKAELKKRGAKLSGKKADLVTR